MRNFLVFLFVLVLSPVVLLASCGEQSPDSPAASDGKSPAGNSGNEHQTGANNDKERKISPFESNLSALIAKVEMIHEEYANAVDEDGNVTNQTEHMEAKMFSDGALNKLDKMESELEKRDAGIVSKLREKLEEVKRIVKNRESVGEEKKLVEEVVKTLEQYRSAEVDPNRKKYVSKIGRTDSFLQTETISGRYRVGMFTREPLVLRPAGSDQTGEATPDGSFYVGVAVREKHTKRYLPGCTVTIRLGDKEEHEYTAEPVWGNFFHYGVNVPVDPSSIQGRTVNVRVSPPAYSRHAEMKSLYREGVSMRFELAETSGDELPVFAGSGSPAPVEDRTMIGAGIMKGFGEARDMKASNEYRIGFIAEGPEPYWIYRDGSYQTVPGEEGENHVEIVLMDAASNDPVPYAEVTLTFVPEGASDADGKTVTLEPLLAEFYHYGKNVKLEPGTYEVTANVRPAGMKVAPAQELSEAEVTFRWTKE